MPVYEKIGDTRERAVVLGKIADILKDRGHLDEALRIRQEEQLPVYEKIDDVHSRLVAWANIAVIYLERGKDGDRERANEFLCKALADADRLRIPAAEAIRSVLEHNGLTCE